MNPVLKIAGSMAMLATVSCRAETAARPNVVLIIADDHRADWMGHKGAPFMQTPNLDRMAAEGISFENAFACSGVCSPSRASILTGRYAHRASAPEIIWQNNSFLRTQHTFAEQLKAAGYRTAYIGKLHLGEDEQPKPGFDEWIGFPFVGNFHDQPLWVNGEKTEGHGFTDDRLAELAAERILNWSGGDQPFCLIVGLKSPHIPFQFPDRMKGRLAGTFFEKPATWALAKPGLKGNCLPAEKFQPAIPSYGSFQEWVRSYSRLALTIDESVGTIFQSLEKTGELDNTLLIYTSDQGYSLGEFGLSEKHYAYEQVMRVPMVVRYPKIIPPGSARDQMVLNIDIAPTILDAAGAAPLDGMDGASWLPLFSEQTLAWRDQFFFSFFNEWETALPPMQAVRTDRYKLIDYQATPVKELYDLKNDPLEKRDLYNNPELADVQREMEERLGALEEEIGFHPREIKLLESCFLIPAGADEEALRKQLSSGELPSAARRLEQPFDLSGLNLSAGDVFYVAVPVERLTEYDPYVTFEFFEAGGSRQWNKKHLPMAAFCGGERIWMSKPYAQAQGLAYEPIGKFNDKCNFPLMQEKSFAVFRGVVPEQMPKFQVEVQAPQGAVRFIDVNNKEDTSMKKSTVGLAALAAGCVVHSAVLFEDSFDAGVAQGETVELNEKLELRQTGTLVTQHGTIPYLKGEEYPGAWYTSVPTRQGSSYLQLARHAGRAGSVNVGLNHNFIEEDHLKLSVTVRPQNSDFVSIALGGNSPGEVKTPTGFWVGCSSDGTVAVMQGERQLVRMPVAMDQWKQYRIEAEINNSGSFGVQGESTITVRANGEAVLSGHVIRGMTGNFITLGMYSDIRTASVPVNSQFRALKVESVEQ